VKTPEIVFRRKDGSTSYITADGIINVKINRKEKKIEITEY